jgi:hypothetical protein
MTQPDFDWTAPVQRQAAPTSQACSREGAAAVKAKLATQLMAVLNTYKYQELTDAQVSSLTGIQRTSVIPRRRELMKRGLVEKKGTARNPDSGVTNVRYGLVGA